MTRLGRRRLGILLGGACVALAAWTALALLRPPETAASGARPAEAARLDLANLNLPPLDAFPETTRRPLFSTTRSPAAPAEPAGQEGLILGRYAFVGAVVTGRQRLVLLRPAAGGALLRLREGDALDSWHVEKIAADALTLRDGARTQTVPLRPAAAAK